MFYKRVLLHNDILIKLKNIEWIECYEIILLMARYSQSSKNCTNAFPQYMYLLLHDLMFIVMRFATGLSYGLYPHAYIWINQINRYRFV